MQHVPHQARLLMVILIAFSMISCVQLEPDKASPFEQVRWVDDAPEVLIDSTWYAPITIEGVQVTDILAFCSTRWPGMMKKRFGEDLPEAMMLMGHRAPRRVDLELKRLSDGETVTLQDVLMSERNRRAIWEANKRSERTARSTDRGPRHITRDQALADITEFERGLDGRFAYRSWRGIDLTSRLDALRSSLDEKVDVNDFARSLNAIMATFGDGHAFVRSPSENRPSTYPPFLVEWTGSGFIALRPDRSGFLDDAHPYIMEIDGITIEEWLETVRPQVVDGSPQLIRARSIRDLRDLEGLRKTRGLPASDSLTCRLAMTPDGGSPIDERVAMTPSRPIYGDWPRTRSRILPGNIGYLRIESMDPRLIPGIRESMALFRDTDGLIIDVRGNGGGSRAPLIALAGYLKAPEDDPWVGNVARYRLNDDFDRDHLDARFMYRADDSNWTDEQRAVIDAFATDFEPEWEPGSGFSAWHYLLLDNTGDLSEYFYDKPVVILSGPNCFSATDIFLGALSGRPRITTMGRASGGGSARSQGFRLPASGAEVRCASMASFRPDGRLYDGRGIEVDVEVDPAPEFFTTGGDDAQLDAAVRYILNSGTPEGETNRP
jgi:hypothetical protein